MGILRKIWQLVFPRTCAMCGEILRDDECEVCLACLTRLPRTEHAAHRDNLVERLLGDEAKLLRAGSFCFYPREHAIRHGIRNMKFDSRPEVGQRLARLAAEEWGNSHFFDGIDYIIPLPLHPDRLRKRGYNQAAYIAQGIHEVTGIPIDTQHLVRIVNNDKQSRMSYRERAQLGEIFRVKNPQELRNKTVLLVDDVITSGTTMQRAMQALHAIPKCHYVVFSLAMAGRANITGIADNLPG